MKKSETIQVLQFVKGNWFRQPTDDSTIEVWADTLAEVEYQDAVAAVRAFIASGDSEIPTVGAIRKLAVDVAAKRRQAVVKLPWPEPTEAEREYGRRLIRETIEKLGTRGVKL